MSAVPKSTTKGKKGMKSIKGTQRSGDTSTLHPLVEMGNREAARSGSPIAFPQGVLLHTLSGCYCIPLGRPMAYPQGVILHTLKESYGIPSESSMAYPQWVLLHTLRETYDIPSGSPIAYPQGDL